MDNRHAIRRAILQTVIDSDPACTEIPDILRSPQIKPRIDQGLLTDAGVLITVRELCERGYVRDLRPGRSPLFRITPAGRGQINQDDDLTEFIWGQMASKFQA